MDMNAPPSRVPFRVPDLITDEQVQTAAATLLATLGPDGLDALLTLLRHREQALIVALKEAKRRGTL